MLDFYRHLLIWGFLISTEGALRRPISFNDHPIQSQKGLGMISGTPLGACALSSNANSGQIGEAVGLV